MADHGLILHFDHDYILQANGENLAWCIIVHEDILTSQFLVMSQSPDTLIIGGGKRTILFPISYVVPNDVKRDHKEGLCFLKDALVDRNKLQCWRQII